MLKLRHRDITVPGGWRYQQPNGPMIEGGDLGHLIEQVTKYRIKFNLPVSDVAAEVEDEICRRTGAKCAPPKPALGGTRAVTTSDVFRFLFTMKSWIKNGSIVEQSVAERRAEVCAGCKFQVTPTGCFGCSGILGTIFALIGDRKTRMDDNLKSCGICGCDNHLSVYVPLPVLHKFSGDTEWPEDTDGNGTPCWKRISPN